MIEFELGQLTAEILTATTEVGQVDHWIDERLNGTVQTDRLNEACAQATEMLLTGEPSATGRWEHFLFSMAAHSHASGECHSLGQCKVIVAKVCELITTNRCPDLPSGQVVTIATGLTVALAAESRLRQSVEEAIKVLCEAFPLVVPEMAQACQDIWLRQGQTTGAPSLFW